MLIFSFLLYIACTMNVKEYECSQMALYYNTKALINLNERLNFQEFFKLIFKYNAYVHICIDIFQNKLITSTLLIFMSISRWHKNLLKKNSMLMVRTEEYLL